MNLAVHMSSHLGLKINGALALSELSILRLSRKQPRGSLCLHSVGMQSALCCVRISLGKVVEVCGVSRFLLLDSRFSLKLLYKSLKMGYAALSYNVAVCADM